MKLKELKTEVSHILDKVNNFTYVLRRPFLKIWKILCYIPILWKDEDWDFTYALLLLEYKIKRTSNYIKNNNTLANNEIDKIVESSNKALSHLKNYFNPEESYEQLHGPLPFSVGHKTEPITDKPNLLRMITINKETGKELTKEEDEIFTKYVIDLNEFEQDEWNNFFDTLKKHGQEWWE